jgi:hypothetical protein
MSAYGLILTPAQLEEAREWVSDCEWRERFDADEISELTAEQIERGLEQHYAGGRRQFILDGLPVKP